jgi:hypothetical protein
MNKLKLLKYAFFVAITLVVSYLSVSFIDPDFGWHLSTGNLILKSGLPKTDPFSYTMPSFPFTEHEWLVDIVFAKLYPLIGLTGISIIFSALFLSAIFIAVLKAKTFKNVFIIIGISSLLQFFSVSPKIFSWLLFSIFTLIVFSPTFWKKYWFWIPPMMLLWTNLHGSFPIALVILLITVICKSVRERHLWIKGILVALLSFLVTLINPYGIKLWQFVWVVVSDSSIKSKIAEWQPTYINMFAFPFLAIFLLTISVVFISKYRNKFKIEQIIINLILFVQAMLAVRNVAYWVIFDIPMVVMAINYYFDDVKKSKIGRDRFSTTSKAVFIFVSIIFIIQCLSSLYARSNTYKESVFYPKGAISYLKQNPSIGQIYSEYNWGGYLIWKLPEKKVFVYGMMPISNWKAGIPGESDYAMNDYMDITRGDMPYKVVFDKFGIDTALLSVRVHQDSLTQFAQKIENYFMPRKKEEPKVLLYEQLAKDGWNLVYQDSSSVIYKKPGF